MDKYCKHDKIYYDCKTDYYLFTWSIPKVSSIDSLNVNTDAFKIQNGGNYIANLCVSKDKIIFRILSSINLKCSVSMFIGSDALFSNTLNDPTRIVVTSPYPRQFDLAILSSEHESFQKLKQHPNDALVLICRMKHPANSLRPSSVKVSTTSMDTLCNLKTLAVGLKNSPETLLKEKVVLQVGNESENVSKAVLCARSPVFANMFHNDMKELRDNTIAVTDIQMPVLKTLVAFLYSGKLWNYEFEFLCELYYAADKYDIADLRQACIDLLIPQISMKNIIRILKLAFSHNDEQLKSSALTMIAANIETWVSTNDWKNLINDEPKIAVEVLNFFNF